MAAKPPGRLPADLENINREILERLLEQTPVSGEALAARLGLSRTAVWKHIRRLKGSGLAIESRPGKGYRLISRPDFLHPALIQRLLTTRILGQTIHTFSEIDSTNSRARELAEQGAGEGTLVAAEHQTRGRGRMDRGWLSPPGENLLFSLLLRPHLPPQQTFSLIMLASVSLCRAVYAETGLEAGIKWPNDIYLKGKKLAGILAEFAADSDRVNHVIIGLGVNVNWFPEKLPPGSQPATSLQQEAGRRISRVNLLASFLNQAEGLYQEAEGQGYGFLRGEWGGLSLVQDRPVRIETGKETWRGIARGIDEQGALIVSLAGGRQKLFHTGDVHLRI
ncbi:MAG: biotin--[acetyl-CoA-carboxylase] ligase [Deltaproteobacteria bacterium]|nr:biotin--[acetyl-CoA-carboxylase] ligase [Deltaproteobacteria bacterium]